MNLLLALHIAALAAAREPMPGFARGPWFDEQVKEETLPCGVRLYFVAPMAMRADLPTLVVFYATPNGNTIEQTLGCAEAEGLDWHYCIQHVAAQTRLLRDVDRRENVVLVVAQTQQRSWPAWRSEHADGPALVRGFVERIVRETPGKEVNAVLTGHSGGGSMTFAFLDAYEAVPAWVKRIAFLDSNYSYSEELHHDQKMLSWLSGDASRRMVIIAYDDREIELDGKKVVSPTGGTFRASHRMLNRIEHDYPLTRSSSGDIDRFDAIDGRINVFIHRNPHNKILHTALVGDMSGYLHALTLGTPEERKWGAFAGPAPYGKWIQPSPTVMRDSPDLAPQKPHEAACPPDRAPASGSGGQPHSR